MKKICINTGEIYSAYIHNSFLNKLPDLLTRLKIYQNLFIVIDEKVYKYHKKKIESAFYKFGKKKYFYILPSGEKSKSEYELKKIYNSLLENKFGRDTVLIAAGGGVTGDIAGYAAATYMRGIQLVHVPTTLLAMIDSSIGGKTGINLGKRKNIIGAFYQPKLVFIDTEFLTSLPIREFDSAFGELTKYGLISGEQFYTFLLNNIEKIKSLDDRVITKTIYDSISIKAAIVSQDEFENKGIRKVLNLGHTFAHSFESNFGFKIKHGEAVMMGLVCALYLSRSQGLLNDNELNRLLFFTSITKIPEIAKSIDNRSIIRAMSNDKKNTDDKIMFVLLSQPGKVVVDVPVDEHTIKQVLNKVKNDVLFKRETARF